MPSFAIFMVQQVYSMEDNPVWLAKFAAKNIDFLSQRFEEGSLKSWNDLKTEIQFNKWNLFSVVTTKTCYSAQVEDNC